MPLLVFLSIFILSNSAGSLVWRLQLPIVKRVQEGLYLRLTPVCVNPSDTPPRRVGTANITLYDIFYNIIYVRTCIPPPPHTHTHAHERMHAGTHRGNLPGLTPGVDPEVKPNPFKVPCAPKWFDFELPIIKTTKLLVKTGSGTWVGWIYPDRLLSSCRAPLSEPPSELTVTSLGSPDARSMSLQVFLSIFGLTGARARDPADPILGRP